LTTTELQRLIPAALSVVDSLGVENANLSLASGPQGLRIQVDFRDVTLRAGRLDGVALDEGRIWIEDLDPTADLPTMKATARIRVEHLVIRVSASLVNRLLESEFFKAELQKRSPVDVRNLELLFTGKRMTFRGQVRKGLTFPFEVQLALATVNNRLRVAFKEFWAAEMVPMPGFLRRLLMAFARSLVDGRAELKGLVRIEDDFAEINPWPKVPLNVEAEFKRFEVEGHFLVIEMGPSASITIPPQTTSEASGKKPEVISPAQPTPAPLPSPELPRASLPPPIPVPVPPASSASSDG
jgi:hypothetical protein